MLRLWLVGKRVVDFLLVLTELLSLAITVEALSGLVLYTSHGLYGSTSCCKSE